MKSFIQLLIILFLVNQTNWVNHIEKEIKKIDTKGTLIKSKKEETEKYGTATIEIFKLDKGIKVKGHYKFEQMNIDSFIYMLDDKIIAEFASGIEPLTYKTPKKDNQPYAILKEKQVFFKNRNEGIEKTRRIELFEIDDIEQKRMELHQLDFKTDTIAVAKYKRAKERFDIIMKNI